MTDLFQEPEDATPLDPSERDGLKQSWITHRRDLNEAEQANIVNGAVWARRRRDTSIASLLAEEFTRELHRRMFGNVWAWAGTYRTTPRNIGIEAYRIPLELLSLFDDARFWVDNKTYAPDEIALRLHHRLVWIHPFPNGNGRHARLMADLLIERLGGAPFSWGDGGLAEVGALRRAYIDALQAGDRHDIAPLLAFARS
ncbi:MAG: mobile mystery protein B [Hyphomicrobiales bacterium]|nr:MAG: mobile mystery protein B [Hyphomicrobiales bacterium]